MSDRTPMCCTLECDAPAVWRVRFSPQLEDYTECCDPHLHGTLAEGNPMRTLILRIDAPLMEGVDLGQHDEPDTEAVQ